MNSLMFMLNFMEKNSPLNRWWLEIKDLELCAINSK